MKTIFTTLIVCLHLLAQSQTYQPFPTAEASWKTGRCWYFYPGGWHDQITFDVPGEDTIINSVTYKKVFMKFHHAPGTAFDTSYVRFLGGMREAGKKIYFVSEELCLDTLERMIYDFNYEFVGDTIYTDVLTNGPLPKVPHVITAIDSVLISGSYHRRLHLSDTLGNPFEWWMEGVGSSWGLVYASYWIMTDNSYDLVCFNTYNTLKYQNPSPGYAFCVPPVPAITCDSGGIPTAIINMKNRTCDISLAPNPAADRLLLNINSSGQGKLLLIFRNMMGETMLAKEHDIREGAGNFELKLENFPAGIYFVEATLNGQRAVHKLVKQ